MAAPVNRFVLRPFELKHVFDFTLRIYRANFTPMFLAMAMVQLPLTLLTLPFWIKYLQVTSDMSSMQMGGMDFETYFTSDIDTYILMAILLLVAGFYQLLVMPLGTLTCCKLAMQTLLNEPWSFAEAFRHARQRYWPTQVALATFFLPLLVISLLILIPVLIFSTTGNEAGTISSALFGMFLITLGGFATFVFWFRMYPAMTGAIQSIEAPEGHGMLANGVWYLKRAWQLTQGHWLRSIGYFTLLYFAVAFISRGMMDSISILVLLGQMVAGGDLDTNNIVNTLDGMGTDPLSNGLIMVLGSLIGIFIAPVWQSFASCMVVDLRCRKEGMDLHLLLDSMPQPTPPEVDDLAQ